MQTVISVFGDHKAARRALACLVEAGFPRRHVHLLEGAPPAGTSSAAMQGSTARGDFDQDRSVLSSIGHFLASAFGQDPPSGYVQRYEQAARRGDSVVIVEVDDADAADRTSRILRELGASDVDAPTEQSATARPARPAGEDRVKARAESERAMAANPPRDKRTGESDLEPREHRGKPPEADREFLP